LCRPRHRQAPFAIDETAARRGHVYVTLFVDIDRRRVLFVADGRDANKVAAVADDFEAHNGDASHIKEVCIDMSGPFIKGVDYNLTEAEITFDKFHAVKLVNGAVDKVRRAKNKDRPELKRSRYLWLKNERHLSAEQSASLDALSRMHLKDCARLSAPACFPGDLREAIPRLVRAHPRSLVQLGHPIAA
jgi:transposase